MRFNAKFIGYLLILFIATSFIFAANPELDRIFNELPAVPSEYKSKLAVSDNPTGKIRLIVRNQHAWFARWAILENAKESIIMTYFIYEKDIFGQALMGLMLKKARQGLKITIMADARGTKGYSRTFLGQDYLQKLVKYSNVKIRIYNPVYTGIPTSILKGLDMDQISASNHDKIIIVDGEWVVIGGRNVSKNYFASFKDDKTVFRDSDVVIKSRDVAKIAEIAFMEEFDNNRTFKVYKDIIGELPHEKKDAVYLELAYKAMVYALSNVKKVPPIVDTDPDYKKKWEEYQKEISVYKALRGYLPYIENLFYKHFATSPAYKVKILDKHSKLGERNDITPNLIKFIDASKYEIVIQNPYVVITPEMKKALKRASDRGVKIIIHTNSPVSTDSLLTQAIFLQDWKDLLKELPTCRIFVMKDTHKLHAKVFVFDTQLSVVGTYNMDYVSQNINSEVVTVIDSVKFAKLCRQKIREDIHEYSVEYKISVDKDGEIKVIYGPENHCSPELLKKIKLLGKVAKYFKTKI